MYGQANSVTSADKKFMDKAAQADLAEVKLGQLAQDKSSNQAVKDFGKRMVTDHTNNENQLKGLASSDNVTLPANLDAKDRALYNRLSKLSGTQFDREYMQSMVKDHQNDVAEFQRESKMAHDSGVRSYADSTLPVLHQHLSLAQSVSGQVGATASK